MADDKKAEKAVTHKLELTRGGIALIESCLSQPGWTKDMRAMYKGGMMLEDLDALFTGDSPEAPELNEKMSAREVQQIKQAYDADHDAWARAPAEWMIGEKEREALKACVKHHVEQGSVRPTVHFCKLAEQLGLIED